MFKISNFIGGNLVAPIREHFLKNYNPSTGKVYSLIPESDNEDLELAVKHAKNAYSSWSKSTLESRFLLLNRIAELIDRDREKLAISESIDQGKNIKQARAEMLRSAQNFRFFATAIMQFASETHQQPEGYLNYTLRQPIGLVACISPWNLPLYLFSWKIAPALAAGNCVIAKPSEVTPVTAFMLSELFIEAGFPQGVISILHGSGSNIGKLMVEHPEIKAISFTGSTRAGSEIASIASPKFKKLSLELGGKNPTVIFKDADFDLALKISIQAAFQNQGEICLCGSRIYVEKDIYERFLLAFISKTKELTVSHSLDEKSNMGAIVSEAHFNKILSCIELAKSEGGLIETGGRKLTMGAEFENGWYIEPTVITNLPKNCKTNSEEIFGPVVSIQPFESEQEAVELSNGCGYGLAAIIFTTELQKAHRVAENLQAGIVWINSWLQRDLRTPFGGVKNSGIGREGGVEALRFFTEPKNVCLPVQ